MSSYSPKQRNNMIRLWIQFCEDASRSGRCPIPREISNILRYPLPSLRKYQSNRSKAAHVDRIVLSRCWKRGYEKRHHHPGGHLHYHHSSHHHLGYHHRVVSQTSRYVPGMFLGYKPFRLVVVSGAHLSCSVVYRGACCLSSAIGTHVNVYRGRWFKRACDDDCFLLRKPREVNFCMLINVANSWCK